MKFGGIFDLDIKRATLRQLEERMAETGFWNDQQSAQRIVQQVKTLKGWIDPFESIEARLKSASELEEMLAVEPDADLERELDRDVAALTEEIESFRVRSLLTGPDDMRDAQLEISAGAGGTEAQDWAQMLMRMYTRWAERKGYGVDILDMSEGEEAGIKGAVLEIKGPSAFGFLKAEIGVHRLVRISPFDAQARRHTSFASVFVYPVVDETITIDVRDEDIKMDVFRASGAGGQHVNKTSSAVRLTHIPTGIVCASQQERSQHKNRQTALKMLKNRLYQLEAEKLAKKKADLDATKQDVTFGSQIRSYVFQPYTMVNDHRTELKFPDVQRVMDGDIDRFIEAYLKESGGGGAEKTSGNGGGIAAA
jgi:peptide chain release factor 2